MRIRITGILGKQPLGMVEFETEFGKGRGIWMSGYPKIAREYHVEFEIVDMLKWGKNLSITAVDEFELQTNADSTHFHGRIEHVDDAGIYEIRLGTSLMMIETDRQPIGVGYSVWFKVKSTSLLLYDMNV